MRIQTNRFFEAMSGPILERANTAWAAQLVQFFARGNRVLINGRAFDATLLGRALQLPLAERGAFLSRELGVTIDYDDLKLFLDDLMVAEGTATSCDFSFTTTQATDAGIVGSGSYGARGNVDFGASARTGGILPPAAVPVLRNARFAGNPELAAVLSSGTPLRPGASGPAVQTIRQALVDLGFARASTATTFDAELAQAVERFQREAGIPVDGTVGPHTLRSLDRVTPPPGRALVSRPEYDRLLADGRLDITLALGHDESGSQQNTLFGATQGLTAAGFREVRPEQLDANERRTLGLENAPPELRYFVKNETIDGRTVPVVVRVLVSDAASPERDRALFTQAMGTSEVVIYSGHARYGTGPDFDDIHSGAGNFVIDPVGNRRGGAPPAYLRGAISGRQPDTQRVGSPGYQLLFMYGCTTENYLRNLRNPRAFPGRTNVNTDIVTSTLPLYFATATGHVLDTINALRERRSLNELRANLNQREGDMHEAAEGQQEGHNAIVGDGFVGNP